MSSEFEQRFGVGLSPGPKNPDRPEDGFALYERQGTGLARRYTFDAEGNAINTAGEVAFRVDSKGRYWLPNGRQMAAPRVVPRPAADNPAGKLYGKPKARTLLGNTLLSKPAKPSPVPRSDDEARLAAALYGPRGSKK